MDLIFGTFNCQPMSQNYHISLPLKTVTLLRRKCIWFDDWMISQKDEEAWSCAISGTMILMLNKLYDIIFLLEWWLFSVTCNVFKLKCGLANTLWTMMGKYKECPLPSRFFFPTGYGLLGTMTNKAFLKGFPAIIVLMDYLCQMHRYNRQSWNWILPPYPEFCHNI